MSVVCSGMPQRSLNASPRSALREYTTRTRSRPRWPWSVLRVEVADQPGAEHRDRVAFIDLLLQLGSEVRPRTRSRPATRARSLARRHPAGGLAEAAVGNEREPLGRDAGRQDRFDPVGDLVGRLEVVILDVDDAGRDVPAGVRRSRRRIASRPSRGWRTRARVRRRRSRASRRGPADMTGAPAAGRGSCRSRGGRRAGPGRGPARPRR